MKKRRFFRKINHFSLKAVISVFLITALLLSAGGAGSAVYAEEDWWAEDTGWAEDTAWTDDTGWADDTGWTEDAEWTEDTGWADDTEWTEDTEWTDDAEWTEEDDWTGDEQWYEDPAAEEEQWDAENAWDEEADPEDAGMEDPDGQEEADPDGEALEAADPEDYDAPEDPEAAAPERAGTPTQPPQAPSSQYHPQDTSSVDPSVQTWPQVPDVDGEAVVLMEANTQAVVYEKNAQEKMYPASTTKILTALVVLEHCSLNETVTFTQECCDLEEGAVTIDSVPGEQFLLKDVMYGLLLPSGNDCAMALAIHTAGSVDRFVEMMNEKAREIGATSSHFANPSGLFHSNHYTTASDLALIARYAFQNSTFVDIISHPTYIIEPTNKTPESRVLVNTHEMITPGNPDYNSDVIGGKTGYLYESGRCLVTYAQRDGVTLLAVILDGSYYGIFSETQELLDFGWDHFTIVNVSESERRFSYFDESAKVQLDPASEILTLNNVSFSDLSSRINYAYYLDENEYAKAKEAAGIKPGDPRQLYAWIDYSYAGYYLGTCNVFINPELKYTQASFINMIYINIWLVLLIVVVVIITGILIVRAAQKANSGKADAKAHRKSGRARTRYYNRSDSVDLRNQYIRTGNRNRSSVRGLTEIGIPRPRKKGH